VLGSGTAAPVTETVMDFHPDIESVEDSELNPSKVAISPADQLL